MNKRVFFMLLICCIFSVGRAFSQTGLPTTNPNAEHDYLMGMLMRSGTVILPDSVKVFLQKHAADNHIDPNIVMKYSIFLKILYNSEITDAEKIDACNFGLRAYAPNKLLPASIFNDFKRTHSSNH